MRSASPRTAANGEDRRLKLLLWPLLAAITFGLVGFGELMEEGRIGRMPSEPAVTTTSSWSEIQMPASPLGAAVPRGRGEADRRSTAWLRHIVMISFRHPGDPAQDAALAEASPRGNVTLAVRPDRRQ